MPIAFLPPSNVSIASMLREDYIYDVRLDSKKKGSGEVWTVKCELVSNENVRYYQLRKLQTQKLRQTTDLKRPRSAFELGHSEVSEEVIDMQRIVQVRGPLLRDLALGYEQKDTYCDTTKTIGEIGERRDGNAARVAFLNKPNKPKPKDIAPALSISSLASCPYLEFVEKTTRMTEAPNVPDEAMCEISVRSNNIVTPKRQGKDKTAFFFKLQRNKEWDYFCNLKIHEEAAVDTYVRAHNAPYDVTNFRIKKYSNFLRDRTARMLLN